MNKFDPEQANAARMYDFFLGGKDNYEADRAAVAKLVKVVPEAPPLARANRVFALDIVHRAAASGIRQFVDVGTGLPTPPSVFEAAAQHPGSKVVGVDNDPVVLAHCRAQMPGHPGVNPSVAVIGGDVRDPDAIFTDRALTDLLDLRQPVAVLLVAVLHFIEDGADPAGIVTRIRQRLAPGSVIALSHACSTGSDPAALKQISTIYDRSDVKVHFRTEEEIQALLGGLELAQELTDVQHWPLSRALELPESFDALWQLDRDPAASPLSARMVATVTAPLPG
jgi:O-methyltransferase involved in polyketide biosynthesis